MNVRTAPVIIVVAALIALYGSDAQAARLCRSFQSNKALSIFKARPAPTTTVEEDNAILDGDLKNGAAMALKPGATSGGATFIGTFARNDSEVAGILLKLPAGQTTVVTVTTYDNGKIVDTASAGTQVDMTQTCAEICERRDASSFFGIKTTAPFDQIRVAVQISGSTDETVAQELCGR
jgi:hypothetical protein